MPLPQSRPAAVLAFDAAVSRARSRRVSDTPYPREDARNEAASAPVESQTPATPLSAQAQGPSATTKQAA